MISLQLVHHNHNNNLDLLLPRCGQPYSRTHVPPPPAAIPTAITGTYTPCWAPVAQTCTLALTSRRAWALVGMTSMSLLYFYFTLFCSVRLPACLWRFWFTCAVTATSCGPRQGTLLSQGVWPRQLRTASTNRCAHRFLSRESLSHIYCLCCAAKCAR